PQPIQLTPCGMNNRLFCFQCLEFIGSDGRFLGLSEFDQNRLNVSISVCGIIQFYNPVLSFCFA
ncbi:MAG: hypothetical protein JSW00_05785, partial [Thermoplasmata archaeon]